VSSAWEKVSGTSLYFVWLMFILYIFVENSHFYCWLEGGHLLISNTGLLGIVCSCHCCHMSILKFCEVNYDKTGSTLYSDHL
jgi:hypothetical protein